MNDFQSRNQQQPQGWQQQQPGAFGSFGMETAARAGVAERMGFIRKVYALFFAATLFAVAGVGAGLMYPPVMIAIASHPWMTFFVLIGGVMGAQAVRLVPGVNLLALFAFTTLTGLVISPAIAIYTRMNPASIWQAGLMTVGIFGGLTAYVFISKKDFSFMRGMMMTGLIVVVMAGVLNLFIVGSSALAFGVSCAALLLFSGFVLYDTSNIIRRYPTNEYVAGALDLYLDAFNIFLALLRILNAGRR
ncbi:MAG: modulator of FtsH protease [Acidobacteriota bacterium]|jgi:FtsH-binding integral membrane protein|nr:modulator of FtsH protease [Acidobacteriota bacterium]